MSVPQTALKKTIMDAQTGKNFEVIPEGKIDIAFAWLSAAYSIGVILFLVWLVLNILYGQIPTTPEQADAASRTIAHWLKPLLLAPASKLIFYTAVGGAIGAAVNNLRSFITWHAEERAFGWRFIWKYLAMPPLGGTLAVLVYGILQGGMTIFTGGSQPNSTAVTALSAWATGTLAGYGAHKVFKWLDEKVNTLFKVDAKQTTVPDVTGKSLDQAKQSIVSAELKVGTVSTAPTSSDKVDKVIAQVPDAAKQVECGSVVELTVGIAGGPGNEAPKPGTTNVTTTPTEEARIASNGNSAKVTETASTGTSDGKTIGTVKETTTPAETATPKQEAAIVGAGTTIGGVTIGAAGAGSGETNTDETHTADEKG